MRHTGRKRTQTCHFFRLDQSTIQFITFGDILHNTGQHDGPSIAAQNLFHPFRPYFALVTVRPQ